jgi:hypothetical protein
VDSTAKIAQLELAEKVVSYAKLESVISFFDLVRLFKPSFRKK